MKKKSNKHYLKKNHSHILLLATIHNRILLLVALVPHSKVKTAQPVRQRSVYLLQALLKVSITLAVQPREIIVVRQAVLHLSSRDIVTVIVITAALVLLLVLAQILVVIGRVSGTAPFGTLRKCYVEISD